MTEIVPRGRRAPRDIRILFEVKSGDDRTGNLPKLRAGFSNRALCIARPKVLYK